MIVKSADDRSRDLDALRALLKRRDVPLELANRIALQLRSLEASSRVERATAAVIDGRMADAANWAAIHDLDLEFAGQTAHIDHVLINRFMEIVVCDSRDWSEGMNVSADGRFAARWEGRDYPAESPIERARASAALLRDLLTNGIVETPLRLGVRLPPVVRAFVLTGDDAVVSGLEALGADATSVQRVSGFLEYLDCEVEAFLASGAPVASRRATGARSLESFARRLADLHAPAPVDWPAFFGLTAEERGAPTLSRTVRRRKAKAAASA